jgi:hypothetical protein
MKTAQITATTTATLLVSSDPHDQTVNLHCESGSAYIGSSTVTASTGFKIDSNNKVELPLGAYESLYAITSTGTTKVYVYSEVN